jgi:hypothetical protein
MPLLTRFHIKTALISLALAMALGIVLALAPVLDLPSWVSYLQPSFFHLIMVGWVTQMIFGVIFWMFPIVSRARPRGNERLGWATYVLLNAGLALRVVAEPANSVAPGGAWGWALVASAVMQWLAAVFFVVNAWPRVRDKYRGE